MRISVNYLTENPIMSLDVEIFTWNTKIVVKQTNKQACILADI